MAFWLSGFAKGVGHYFMNVAGALFGAGVHETAGKVASTLGEKVGERMWKYLAPDREDIMKALLRLECNAIIALLGKAERNNGIIDVDGVEYREAWVITKLLEIEERDRKWVFVLLDDVCERNPAEFMIHLNILHNDGLFQLAILIWRTLHRTAANPRLAGALRGCGKYLQTNWRDFSVEFHEVVNSANNRIHMRRNRGRTRRWLGI